jgi:hypothetical protein
MLINYTQSRAAILCFGGWGLQVLLHLHPRLQAAQEQRAALGAVGPNLESVTSFGALTPRPLPEQDRARFDLFRPRPGLALTPDFIARTLANLSRGGNHTGLLTASERRAIALLDASREQLQRLEDGAGPFSVATPRPGEFERITRRRMFQAAAANADRVARLLEINLLDPIRQDNLDPDDPFVQTTLYVVAPLFEPLASALIWPVVTQLMERVGRSHISQVVALLATGSYAADLSRPLEDGAAYAALRELEALAGMTGQPDPATRAALRRLLREVNSPLADQVGASVFDAVYLLDREKNNQGLADDSQELAVLAGNALESFIVAGGDLYLQEQLGVGLHHGEQRPYSLLGAATDYVPVAQVLHAVNRQEESRLVREWVLHATPDEAEGANPLLRAISKAGSKKPPPTLRDLGLEQPAALMQLARRLPDLFTDPQPRRLDDLSVSQRFLLPDSVAAQLRRLPAAEWPAAFDAHLAGVSDYLKLAVGPDAVDECWGLRAEEWRLSSGDWASDERIFPAVLHRVHDHLVSLVNDSPTGLARAQEQVQRWLSEAEQARRDLRLHATPSQRQLEQHQQELALREWETHFAETSARGPSLWHAILGALALTGLAGLAGYGYSLWAGRPLTMPRDGLILLGGGIVAFVIFWAGYRRAQGRVDRLRQERLELAQAEMTVQLRAAVSDGLVRLYDLMIGELERWRDMLGEAADELRALATPPEMPSATPPGARPIHLHAPHLNEQLWERCLAYLRGQQDEAGLSSDARLDNLWGQAAWRREVERIFAGAPDPRRPASDRERAKTLAELIRRTVRTSVAPVSLARSSPARAALIRTLAREFSIERMLWRGREEAEELERQLKALQAKRGRAPLDANVQAFPRRHYVENARNRAKPTANYDVSDRLAVYGVNIDYVAASGQADSDLTRTLLDEYNLTLLPTQDPFSITFVRTVHGLGLDDLDRIRRYRSELRHLGATEKRAVELIDETHDSIYG